MFSVIYWGEGESQFSPFITCSSKVSWYLLHSLDSDSSSSGQAPKTPPKLPPFLDLGESPPPLWNFFHFLKNINLLLQLPVYQFALTSSMSLHSGLPVPEVACCGACCLCCLLWCCVWCCGSGGMGPGGDLSTNPRPGVEEGEEERIRRWLIRAPPPPACHTAACCCCCCCCCCCFGMS